MKKILTLTVLAAILMIAFPVFAGTTTNFTGTAYPVSALSKVYVLENTMTFTATSAGDVVKVIGLNSGSLVLAVGASVTTAQGSAGTVCIGDTVSTNRYLNTVDMNAVGKTVSAASAWYLTTNATSIDISANTALTAGVVRVRAVIADLSR